MSFRASLKNLIRRDTAASLREQRAATAARVEAFKPGAPAAAPITPTHAEQVAHAGLTGDVLAASGIDHRDGTVSYADATGKISRRPTAHWIGFTALQMHTRVQGEMARRRMIEAGDLSAEEHAAWEARIRRELRADAIHALTFQHVRTFEAAQALRTGAEPATQEMREQGDAELLALAPEWEVARNAYDEASQQQLQITAAAEMDGRPGPAPEGSGPDWQAWFQRCKEWRERTGIDAAEEASGDACRALGEVEDRIAALPAASLAGLRLKARVAQRNQDIDVEWPEGLGEGLTRDLLAFTAGGDVDWHSPPPGFMASPAIDPMNFAWIPQGLLIELDRLRDIAEAEFQRRISALRETGNDTLELATAIRASLFLPALTAAIDPGSVEAATLAALGRAAGPDPVLATRGERARRETSLVDMLNLASATVSELRDIQDIAEHVGAVAYAYTYGPRCGTRGRRYGEIEPNDIGKLMHWLGDALTDVETAADKEVARRTPDNPLDRETRLLMRAVPVVENGDVTEIATFIGELAVSLADDVNG